jgi:hypothetical protein
MPWKFLATIQKRKKARQSEDWRSHDYNDKSIMAKALTIGNRQ